MTKRNAATVRDSAATKDSILKAAGILFTQKGYDGVGVREIASTANCNAALVNRYFGSKKELYAKVMEQSVGFDEIFNGPREEFGMRLATVMLAYVPEGFDPMLTSMRSTTSAEAMEIALQTKQTQYLSKITEWLGGINAQERASMIISITSGIYYMRSIMKDPNLNTNNSETLTERLAKLIQKVVDEE